MHRVHDRSCPDPSGKSACVTAGFHEQDDLLEDTDVHDEYRQRKRNSWTGILEIKFPPIDHSRSQIPEVWIKRLIRGFTPFFCSKLRPHQMPLQDFRNSFPESSSTLVLRTDRKTVRLGSLPFPFGVDAAILVADEAIRRPDQTQLFPQRR
ncbi:hypothetical protein BDV18DRAFT_106546 [Aspergillus unguis]